jgi:hypothetical protein
MTADKFDFDAPDCTCGYKDGVIARNMCGHVPPCPVYARWYALAEAKNGPGAPSQIPPVGSLIYVASRASLPRLSAMWRELRAGGWPIISTWIDEAGPGQTDDMGELWRRIESEIERSVGLILYAEPGDFPLKGALIECGIALGKGKRIGVVLPGVQLAAPSMWPIGSWIRHPLVSVCDTLEEARAWVSPAATEPSQKELREMVLLLFDFTNGPSKILQLTDRQCEIIKWASDEKG